MGSVAIAAADEVPASCLSCHWHGVRLKRGPIPAHKVHVRGFGAPKPRAASCGGPGHDRALARALGDAFATAGRQPMPDRRTLSATAPLHMWGSADTYRAAPSWARFMVTIHAPLDGPLTQRDSSDVRPEIRRTIHQWFADRDHAEAWAMACAGLIGGCFDRSTDHGYAAVSVLDRRMKRWEQIKVSHARRDSCGLEPPITYYVIDPGGKLVRFTDPEIYAGYGETPSRSVWERSW